MSGFSESSEEIATLVWGCYSCVTRPPFRLARRSYFRETRLSSCYRGSGFKPDSPTYKLTKQVWARCWAALLSGLLQWFSHKKLCFKTSSFTFNQIRIICCWAISVCDSWLYTHTYKPTGDRWISLLISDFLSMRPHDTLPVMQRHHYQPASELKHCCHFVKSVVFDFTRRQRLAQAKSYLHTSRKCFCQPCLQSQISNVRAETELLCYK